MSRRFLEVGPCPNHPNCDNRSHWSLFKTPRWFEIDYEAAANSHGIPLLEAIDIVNLALGIGGDDG